MCQVLPHLIVTVHCEIDGGVSVLQVRDHTGNQQFLDLQRSHSAHAGNTLLPHSSFAHRVPAHFSLALPSR